MSFFPSKRLLAALPFVVFALAVMLSIDTSGAGLQAPAAGARGQAAPAARGGGGRGGAPLGDGPFDIGEGENRLHVTVITKGLDHPWGMAFLPNGDMLVTERAGRLRVVRKGMPDPTPIAGLPQILVKSLGGLLDIAVHPNFAENRLVYFAYSKPGDIEPTSSAHAV